MATNSTHANVSLPVDGTWTQLFSAGPTTFTVQNLGQFDIAINFGSAKPADGSNAVHDILPPMVHRTYNCDAADVVSARPFIQSGPAAAAGIVVIRTQ